jgi:hypothetical protein
MIYDVKARKKAHADKHASQDLTYVCFRPSKREIQTHQPRSQSGIASSQAACQNPGLVMQTHQNLSQSVIASSQAACQNPGLENP